MARRQRLRPGLADAGVARLLVGAAPNVRYLSGFGGSAGSVLIDASSAADDRLLTDLRYVERASAEVGDLEVAATRRPFEMALDGLGPGEVLGLEAAHVSWAEADRLRERAAEHGVVVEATTDLVESLRTVKDDAEVARIGRACELTVDALAWLLDEVAASGRTERELAVALERRFVDLGADGVAFPSIVASGPNAAIPHHAPGPRRLEPGDLLTVDCGALVDGYHADLTRTVAIGHLDDRMVEVHDLVVRAQLAGRRAARAGVESGEVDEAARGLIAEAGMGERFVHGTGHGVGLEIHEAPAVAQGARATLLPGTTLTVEPGVYLPGTGGVRIEDTIVVTADDEPTILTDLPRELRVL